MLTGNLGAKVDVFIRIITLPSLGASNLMQIYGKSEGFHLNSALFGSGI